MIFYDHLFLSIKYGDHAKSVSSLFQHFGKLMYWVWLMLL
ncbi:hypothetical protein FM120_08440 [Sphingobacterium faecium PCAi_F2.5]|nr:hypothetical protein FM120_08440 [Sphingobacterium faecium PCAi_F2.5]